MANIPVDEAPNLNLDMENFTDKTPVHFDEMNSRHKQHLNNEKALLYPTFDDSGTASGILSFTDFLATVKNRMRLFDFFKNFKTGMQFVMHLGKAANNCTTTATGLYLDARQGKVLMDLYTKLNSDLTSKAEKSELNTKVTGGLDALTNVTFGRASDRIYIRFTLSATSFYQLEIYDDGPLVFARSINGAWATMWTK